MLLSQLVSPSPSLTVSIWILAQQILAAAAAAESLQLCPTLCNPTDAAQQTPLSLGVSRKNIGVGCHFLLQCMTVKIEREVSQSCPTLSDPMDCSLPGSSVHGIFQARVLEWGAIAFSERKLMQSHEDPAQTKINKNQNDCVSRFGIVTRKNIQLSEKAFWNIPPFCNNIFEKSCFLYVCQSKQHFPTNWMQTQIWESSYHLLKRLAKMQKFSLFITFLFWRM